MDGDRFTALIKLNSGLTVCRPITMHEFGSFLLQYSDANRRNTCRHQVNALHISQSIPDSGLGLSHFQCESLENYLQLFPSRSTVVVLAVF